MTMAAVVAADKIAMALAFALRSVERCFAEI
jgi:hypothetical protein